MPLDIWVETPRERCMTFSKSKASPCTLKPKKSAFRKVR